MSTTRTASQALADYRQHRQEADRLVHELVGGITYWAAQAEDVTEARRLREIRGLLSKYDADTEAHYRQSDEAWTPDLDRIRREGRSIAEVVE